MENPQPGEPLDHARLTEFIADPSVAAIRSVLRLQPAAGRGAKIMPPTYEGQRYAEEVRIIDGEHIPCVTVDSVQSQAGRMEDALRTAVDEQRIQLPLIQVRFPSGLVPAYADCITTLDAPHRIADAIFRDSLLDGQPFRDSPVGQAWTAATERNATELFRLCPQALVYGLWDSTGTSGGRGTKFRRLFTSDITAVNTVQGVRTSSRVDPLGIERVEGVYASEEEQWTLDAAKAAKDKRNNPVSKRPSEFNLGNITPDFIRPKSSDGRTLPNEPPIHGGITCDYLIQTPVLSLAGLRRLRFPVNGRPERRTDIAGRGVLAGLSLAALSLQRELGFSLRSGCDLVAESDPYRFEVVWSDGRSEPINITPDAARTTFNQAIANAQELGLPWNTSAPIDLQPSEKLVELVRLSRLKAD